MTVVKIIDEKHWHELRRKNIGGSDAASLFDCNKFQSLYTLWHIKHGSIDNFDDSNERSEWGKRFELPIAQGLAQDHNFTIEKAEYYEHPTIKGMGCTPDFIIKATDFSDDRIEGDGILEIKNLENWDYLGQFTKTEANHYIEIQLQHQFSCTTLKWGVLGYKLPGQTPSIFFRFRDDEFISLLENKVTDFWKSKTPPIPDGSNSSTKAVIELYRRQQGKKFIDMSQNNHLPFLIGQLEGFKEKKKLISADLKAIEEGEKAAKNQIIALSQGAEIIKFSDGEIKISTITIKPNNGYSFQKLTYALNKE